MATAAKSFECVKVLISAKHETLVEDLMYNWLRLRESSVMKSNCIPCHFDCSGKSALAIAAELGLTEIFSFFLQQHIPYRVVDNEGNTPLHLAAASGHLDICQLILDAEREQIIREIQLELGGPEKMQGEFEKASSSFRGGIRTKCKKCTETSHKESTFSSMTTRKPWLREKNYRAKSAAESARISGHVGVATLIENICLEVYSKDFIDLQISFVLHGKCGRNSNRSLSSLNANISSIRSLAPSIRTSLIQKEGFDDEADSVNYSFALVTQGSLLGEYIESQRDIELVYKDEELSETNNEHRMPLSKTVELELPISTVTSMVQNDDITVSSSSSHFAILPGSLAAMKPVNISALPEFKAKNHKIEGSVENLGGSSLKKTVSTEESDQRGQIIKAQSKEYLPKYTIKTMDKENKMVLESNDIEVDELGAKVSENISAIRRNSARDLSNKNSSQLLTSIQRSFSDSKLKLQSLMKR
jgi:ankyrin repeat protein